MVRYSLITKIILHGLLLGPLFLSPALAHPPGLSSLDGQLRSDGLSVKVTYAVQDIEALVNLDVDFDAEVTEKERLDGKVLLAALVSKNLMVTSNGSTIEPWGSPKVEYDQQNNVHVEFSYPFLPSGHLRLVSQLIDLMPPGHQQFASLKRSDGFVLSEKMLRQGDESIDVYLDSQPSADGEHARPVATSFVAFFELGVDHILTGYDHLLFLFGLLVATHSFWPAFKIITFFTVAHSVTLALAALGGFELSPSIVEPLIAATIVYVGIENLICGEATKGRHWLTFFFGLIHGFGFAGVLRELDITSMDGGILLPLFSFNLGIETGQLAMAAIVLPFIWWVKSTSIQSALLLKVGSVVIVVMGGYWFIGRTLLAV
jgi:hydrogenase/urease accessory protein HupE